MPVSLPQIIKRFSENKEHYQKKEIGDWTQGFCRDILESEIFNLKSWDTKVSWNFRYEATVEWEGDRWDDFILNIDGIIVPVEVEKLHNIQKWESQIEGYMKRKNSLYGILTDGYTWKFYTQWYSRKKPTLILTLDELVTSEGQARKDRVFFKKDYYLNSFSSLSALVAQNSDFVLEDFHNDLIRLAEDVKRDFSTAWAFSFWTSDEEQIKGVYSFIIQFILLKIIQDKKGGLDLLGIDAVKTFLEEEKWNKLTQHIFKKLQFLGEFYTSYRNEQEELLKKIREKYTEASVADYDLEALKPFLDLYVFIIKYNFKKTNSDLFWAVYENYLKELYREDNAKKWQVFTPPEIVEFMLDEVGYTTEYIRAKIEEYGVQKIQETLIKWAPLGKSDYTPEEIEKQYFNIPGLSIIDPACWSGTFLYKASGRIANAIEKFSLNSREKWLLAESLIINNIVGFDIEAFPLYLAEMNILITLLWHNIDDTDGKILNRIDKQIRVFSTKDSIAEFANSEESIIDTVIDSLSNLPEFTTSILSKRDEREILKIYMDIRDVDMDHFREMIQVKYLKTVLSPRSPALVKAMIKAKTIEEIRGIFSWSAITDVNETLEKTKFLAEYQKLEKTILPKLNTKITELLTRHEAHRTKFDFVVGNPPYIYADADIKEIFWYDLNNKKYTEIPTKYNSYKEWLDFAYQKPNGTTSKFNLFWYFYYLGHFLMKDWGKMIFITPRSVINKLSMYKVKMFLKKEGSIQKVIDFWVGSLFYSRWINQDIIVWTDSCILMVHKDKNICKETAFLRYTWNSGKITLQDFLALHSKEILSYNDVFSLPIPENQMMFLDYFYDLQIKDKDFHYSIMPWISIWSKKDLSNTKNKGYPIYEQNWYYSLKEDLLRWYDPDENGYEKIRPTCLGILHKKFRVVLNYFNRANLVSYSDYEWIQNWGNWIAIWTNSEDNIKELYYIFGILNSQIIKKYLREEFDNIWSLTSMKLCAVPRISSPTKESLKEHLIVNSEQIINLAKQLQWLKTIWDILDVEKNGMDTKVSWIKQEYEYVSLVDIGGGIGDISFSAPFSKEVMKQIRNENPLMKKLENERDAIVEQLYGL